MNARVHLCRQGAAYMVRDIAAFWFLKLGQVER